MRSASGQVTRCLRPTCGRILTAPASVARGYGRHCAAKIRKAAAEAVAAEWKPEQFAKAMELISDGGLVPAGRAGIYRAASSDGTQSYLCAEQACGCKAGLHDRRCYHRCGAAILNATRNALTKAA